MWDRFCARLLDPFVVLWYLWALSMAGGHLATSSCWPTARRIESLNQSKGILRLPGNSRSKCICIPIHILHTETINIYIYIWYPRMYLCIHMIYVLALGVSDALGKIIGHGILKSCPRSSTRVASQ